MDDTTRILIEVLGLAVLIADAACYAILIRKKECDRQIPGSSRE